MGLRHRRRGRASPQGLNEDIIRLISAKKNEPEFMLEWRLKAYRHWRRWRRRKPSRSGRTSTTRRSTTRTSSTTRRRSRSPASTSLDEVDPELLRTYEKLGIPLEEQKHAGRRGGGCGVRQRLGRHHLQGEAGRGWASSSARSPKRCRSIRSWCRSTSARSCRTPTTSSPR